MEETKPESQEPQESNETNEDENEYPPRKIVLPAMGALYLTVFLIAIDRTIIGTAVPVISNEFHSFGDISWYEAGFLLPLCMLQLSFGRVYTHYPAKWVLITLVAIFEIGSIVCATAPSSAALIIGRAVTGIGAAGVSAGALLLINSLVPLQSRPKYSGGIGAVFGLSSIIGPLAGGYLTAVSWRWCFWINVPIGVTALVVLLFFCPNSPPPVKSAESWLGKIKQLDPLGFALIAPGVTCLLFALQWGGKRYPWNDGNIIALFVMSGVLTLAFIGTQVWKGDNATVPPKILRQRSIFAGCFGALGIGSVLVVYSLYLPIWFQAIQGKSPEDSGLSLLPLLLSQVVAVISSGITASAWGYYTPLMNVGGAIGVVGAALITTWEVDTGKGQWIGFQVLTGIGTGLCLQQPNIAAQTVLPKEQMSIGLTLLAFVNFLGGTVFSTVSQTLLENHLSTSLQGKVPNVNPSVIASAGATLLRDLVPPEKLPLVLEAYNDSLRLVWYLGLALVCLIFVSSFGLEYKSVKASKKDTTEKNPEVGVGA